MDSQKVHLLRNFVVYRNGVVKGKGGDGGMKINLFSHNQSAYDATLAMLGKTGKAAIVHPTGTGKSYIALQLIEDNPDARILYITSLATNLLEFWDKVEALGSYRMVMNLSNIPRHIGTGMKSDLDTADIIAGDDSAVALFCIKNWHSICISSLLSA